MADNFFDVNFARLLELREELAEAAQSYVEIKERLQSLNIRYENLERLMTAEVFASGDKLLEGRLKEILNKAPEQLERPVAERDRSKTEFLVEILFSENLSGRGVTPIELFDLARKKDPNFQVTKINTNDVLSKLRKKGMVEQRDKRYFLTDGGRNHWSKLFN